MCETLELGDFVDKLSGFCHRDLLQAERARGEREIEGERGLVCLTGRYFVVEARLAGARMLSY